MSPGRCQTVSIIRLVLIPPLAEISESLCTKIPVGVVNYFNFFTTNLYWLRKGDNDKARYKLFSLVLCLSLSLLLSVLLCICLLALYFWCCDVYLCQTLKSFMGMKLFYRSWSETNALAFYSETFFRIRYWLFLGNAYLFKSFRLDFYSAKDNFIKPLQ